MFAIVPFITDFFTKQVLKGAEGQQGKNPQTMPMSQSWGYSQSYREAIHLCVLKRCSYKLIDEVFYETSLKEGTKALSLLWYAFKYYMSKIPFADSPFSA